MRFINLTDDELKRVRKLLKTSKKQVVCERCQMLILSHNGNSMREVARLSNVHWSTVVRFFNSWQTATNGQEQLKSLQIAPGRGPKLKLKKVSTLLPDLLHQNKFDLDKVLVSLRETHQIEICKLTLKNFVKNHLAKQRLADAIVKKSDKA